MLGCHRGLVFIVLVQLVAPIVFAQTVDVQRVTQTKPQIQTKSYPHKPPKFEDDNLLTQDNLLNLDPKEQQLSEDYCQLVILNLGWISCGQVQVLSSGSLDPMLTHPSKKNKKQKVSWGTEEQRQIMVQVETQMIERLQAQSDQLDLPIFFQGWMIEPQMNPGHQYIYYATHSLWNNQQVIHLQAQTIDHSIYMMVSIETPIQNQWMTQSAALRLISQIMMYYQEHVYLVNHKIILSFRTKILLIIVDLLFHFRMKQSV